MKVIVLGATGMVGAGSLREALQSVTQGRADGFVLESADINRVGA